MKNRVDAITWLKEFIREVDSQDCRSTTKPIMFLLQTKQEYVANESYYFGGATRVAYAHPELECGDIESKEQAIDWLKEYGYEGDELKEQIKRIKKLEIAHHWETQEVCFTKKGIDQHLSLNKHNYQIGYRDYVIHAFRNPEIHELFNAIRILTQDGA